MPCSTTRPAVLASGNTATPPPHEPADRAPEEPPALIRAFDDEQQGYTSLDVPMWKTRYGVYDDLARIKEWSAAGGPGSEQS